MTGEPEAGSIKAQRRSARPHSGILGWDFAAHDGLSPFGKALSHPFGGD